MNFQFQSQYSSSDEGDSKRSMLPPITTNFNTTTHSSRLKLDKKQSYIKIWGDLGKATYQRAEIQNKREMIRDILTNWNQFP